LVAAVYATHRFQRNRVIRAERERAQVRELAQAKEIEKAYQKLGLKSTELEEQKKELQATVEDLKNTQAQLVQREKMASLGELTAGVAHEIQNPLNFVNNFAEVSEELVGELQAELNTGAVTEARAIAEDLKQNLSKIHHHGQRADAIVKNMLQHSRTTTGEKQLTNLNALADEYLRLAYHGLRAKDKSFTCTLDTNFDLKLEQVEVVPQDLGRVLLNLYNNAFYAVQQKAKLVPVGATGEEDGYRPTVTVSTRQLESQVEIRVRDNGTGMAESIKGKIFQPFFTTKPTGQGTGLGLSLSYDIVTMGHNGELAVETNEGEGTEFIIRLPVATRQKKEGRSLATR
jgi:signal transduction histidine kinase